MRFKKTKQEVLNDIVNNCYGYGNDMPDFSSIPPSQLKGYIENYTRSQVRSFVIEAFESLLDNIYTEEEFEQDIGLNLNKS